jgi:hypothetical protein
MRYCLLTIAPLAAACATGSVFRDRVDHGCRSEWDCLQLRDEAQAYVRECRATGDPCFEEEGLASRAEAHLQYYAGQRHAWETQQRLLLAQQQAAREEAQKAAAAKQREEDVLRRMAELQAALAREKAEKEAAQAERERELADRRRQAESALDGNISGCDVGAEESCDKLRSFVRTYLTHERIEEARRALARSELKDAARRKNQSEQPKRQDTDSGADQGRVCCCDGSVSPTCTYVHRGCCSHHGGVCSCG